MVRHVPTKCESDMKKQTGIAIYKTLADSPIPMSKKQLMQALDLTIKSADFALMNLKKAGCIEQVDIVNPLYRGRVGDKTTVPGYKATDILPHGLARRQDRIESAIRLLESNGYSVQRTG